MLLAAAVLGSLAIVTGYVLGWANRAFSVARRSPRGRRRRRPARRQLRRLRLRRMRRVRRGRGRRTRRREPLRTRRRGLRPGTGRDHGRAGSRASFAYRAVVHCAARRDQRLGRRDYRGEPTCAAANLVAGVQGCTYGCLGLGDCVRACPHGADPRRRRPGHGRLRQVHRLQALRPGVSPPDHHDGPVQGGSDARRGLLEQGFRARGQGRLPVRAASAARRAAASPSRWRWRGTCR